MERQRSFSPVESSKRIADPLFREEISSVRKENPSLDELTNIAIKSNFDHAVIGRHLIDLAERAEGIDLVIAYAAIIAKAKKARMKAHARVEARSDNW